MFNIIISLRWKFKSKIAIVKVDKAKFESLPFTKGVLQGSILGPVLFTIRVNEKSKILHRLNTVFDIESVATMLFQYKQLMCMSNFVLIWI